MRFVVCLAALLVASCDGRSPMTAETIVGANNPIRVPYGRAVRLDLAHLELRRDPDDRCTVRVLDTDALSQLPGRLSPAEFPCDYDSAAGGSGVTYQHFGGRSPSLDRVRLLVRYDTPTNTFLVPLTLRCEVSFQQMEVVTRNSPLTVERAGGVSDALTSQRLQFTYDAATLSCRASVLVGQPGGYGLPRYGSVLRPLVDADCSELLAAGVRYAHAPPGGSTGPRRDYIPMVVRLFDRVSGRLQREEYFRVPVRIRAGKENSPPRVSEHASLELHVDQMALTAVTPAVLAAVDTETPADRIVFNVTRAPDFGRLVATDDRQVALYAFRQRDVRELRVAYEPTGDAMSARRVVTVELTAVDEEGATSAPFELRVVVHPTDSLAPVVTRNAGLQLFEGQSRPLLSSVNLRVSDADNRADVRLTAVGGLRHGSLTVGGVPLRRVGFFTPADLDIGTVVYRHDDSDTVSDNIIFRMTDGEHRVEFLFAVTVYPVDDEPPYLAVNTGLDTRRGAGPEPIRPAVLSAVDTDGDPAAVLYELQSPYPRGGVVLRRATPPPSGDDWTRGEDGFYERRVTGWTQADVNAGRLFYVDAAAPSRSVAWDSVSFRLLDGADPPNLSGTHRFLIAVLPVDDQPPSLSTSLRLSVYESQLTPLTADVLRSVDPDSNDRLTLYTVTSPPYGGGAVVRCDDADNDIVSFTQAEVNAMKICYRPPSEELGLVPRADGFLFQVSDAAGNTLPNQQFSVYLMPVDDKPPEVRNAGVAVEANSSVVVTPDWLDATDEDTPREEIVFRVTRPPSFGALIIDGAVADVGDRFSRDDIDAGLVSYRSFGSQDDCFRLDVTDGTHCIPVTVRVTIVTPVAPVTLTNGVMLSSLTVRESQMTVIGIEHVTASPDDPVDLRRTYRIRRPPLNAAVLLNGHRTTLFTMADVLAGAVVYQSQHAEIGRHPISESFNLTLTPESADWVVGATRVTTIVVHVDVLPVDNRAPRADVRGSFALPEAGTKTIGTSYLSISDRDSEDEVVVCTVQQPPEYGFVENTAPAEGSELSRAGVPTSAFTQRDLLAGTLNYVQKLHRGVEPRRDHFVLDCSDGVNRSPRILFHIGISPVNDEPPEVFSRAFIVQEGRSLLVDTPILMALDADRPPDRLIFEVIVPPQHGLIAQADARGATWKTVQFRMDEIEAGATIVYEHDGSETQRDRFTLTVSDGVHSTRHEVVVLVVPVDDETPRMTINSGVTVAVGSSVDITTDDLRAADLDTPADRIAFVLRVLPQHGYVQRVAPPGGVATNLTRGANFTQAELAAGAVRYRHDGGDDAEMDVIVLDVTDGHNVLLAQRLEVTVTGIDRDHPVVVSRGAALAQHGSVVLTTDLLSSSDADSADAALTFTVTRPPSRGRLTSARRPDAVLASFTQLELAGGMVRYEHTLDDEALSDSFEFVVSDGVHDVRRTFVFTLTAVDDARPALVIDAPLRVREGGVTVITPFELRAVDRDTPADRIVFTVTRRPSHGALTLDDDDVAAFSQRDVDENRVRYRHDGTDTVADSFAVTVTDGVHRRFHVLPDATTLHRSPQPVAIHITAVDDAVPIVVRNVGATTLTSYGELTHAVRLTSALLAATDADSPDGQLVYAVTTPLGHGRMVNHVGRNIAIDSWSQGDIDEGKIFYVLDEGSNATDDSFFFKVIDKGGNVLVNQSYSLRWSWTRLRDEVVSVNETSRLLHVTLQRRGYLGQTAFVTVTAENGTAVSHHDFSHSYAQQVQFNPGETEKSWRLRILDDDVYERSETFSLLLSDAVMTSLETPSIAVVTIHDDEDESRVSFREPRYDVSERDGQVSIPIVRTGDLSRGFIVICSTIQLSANGSVGSSVTSYSDYVGRRATYRSVVEFSGGDAEKRCVVTVVDDSLYEPDESFRLSLSSPEGGSTGRLAETLVVIRSDVEDEPTYCFALESYEVDESSRFVEVKVVRRGTDLTHSGSVTVRSRQTSPVSAAVGVDYVPVDVLLRFAPGVKQGVARVRILDDLSSPRMEGVEKFELVLRLATGGRLVEPWTTVVAIDDVTSDAPTMQFAESSYNAGEESGRVVTYIRRRGDVTHASSVRCYTRQDSATVMADFAERPDSDASRVHFLPGETEQPCIVGLNGDTLHETQEQFRLVLGDARSETAGRALIGSPNTTVVTVTDLQDKSVLTFGDQRFTATEPEFTGETWKLTVPVLRLGDISKPIAVRVYTQDGTATAGKDYVGFSKEFVFRKNVHQISVEVEILHDDKAEMREAFSLILRPLNNTQVQAGRAVIHINDGRQYISVTFPASPVVVSLRHYEDVSTAPLMPTPGYPLICITACDPRHPRFAVTTSLCRRGAINNTLTSYRWRVAAPTGLTSGSHRLKDVHPAAFLASTHRATLDSIYFTAGSRVECVARAVNRNNEAGIELASLTVTVDPQGGICWPKVKGSVGAEPFSAKLRYVTDGPDSPKGRGPVQLTVILPHQDGLLPALSTRPLTNPRLTLSPAPLRPAIHLCSNLLEERWGAGRGGWGNHPLPHEANAGLRGRNTAKFYRSLDLDSCTWRFVSYYSMSDLVNLCGGEISTNGEVLNVTQSYTSLRIPLHVSYLYHAPDLSAGWRQYDLQTKLELTFVYDTSILWHKGISSPFESEFKGILHPTSIRLRDSGHLVVEFKTKALFRGLFTLGEGASGVVSANHPAVTFTLELIRSQNTFDEPEQTWQFKSDLVLGDYSGDYVVSLMACTADANQRYATPVACQPREVVPFDLEIRFQQVSDPVAPEFSLDAEFYLLKDRRLWLSDGSEGFGPGIGASFSPDDEILGRIVMDPLRGETEDDAVLGLNIEKVYLCAGRAGYVPKYDPANGEYGCIGESPNLEYSLRLLDRGAPETQVTEFNGIKFVALMAVDDPVAAPLVAQPGSDGFRISAKPLFQADRGRQWFLHTVYNVRAPTRGKRHVTQHHALIGRPRRAVAADDDGDDDDDVGDIGADSGRGTNLIRVPTAPTATTSDFATASATYSRLQTLLIFAVVFFALLLMVLIVIVLYRRRRHRRSEDDAKMPTPLPPDFYSHKLSSGAVNTVIYSGYTSYKRPSEV